MIIMGMFLAGVGLGVFLMCLCNIAKDKDGN